MSVAGISSSSFFDYNAESVQSTRQQIEQEFQQLGQNLESGNLSAAQSDYATLQQALPTSAQISPHAPATRGLRSKAFQRW